jgi:hypothetical protein
MKPVLRFGSCEGMKCVAFYFSSARAGDAVIIIISIIVIVIFAPPILWLIMALCVALCFLGYSH